MLTVMKLTIANINQKKSRSILIILSIILSVALMYTVLSLSSSTTRIFEHKVRKEVGSAKFMLLPSEDSGEQYIPELDFAGIEGMEYGVSLVSVYGYSEIEKDKVPIVFTGMTAEDYKKVYGLDIIQGNSEELSGNQAWIGEETASQYGVSLGSELVVTIGGVSNTFKISGVVEDKNNNLGYEPGSLELVTDRNTLISILGIEEKVSSYYVKYLPGTDSSSFLADLENEFSKIYVKDVTDMKELASMITMIVSCLLLMVMTVIIVSAFIIYSSFKIISLERMPLMGTLRSIGATRKTTVKILLFEGLFYGLTGGILGNGLGIAILSVTMEMMFRNFGYSSESISYVNINYLIIALIIALVLAVGSAMLPIIKTSKQSIRSIIFAEIHNEKHISLFKTLIGFILVAAGFLLFRIAPIKLQVIMDFLGILMVTVGCALLVPILSSILSKGISLLFRPFYKDSLGIVIANLKNDRTMMNNIMLLAMGLGVILMINNFSSAVGTSVGDLYSLDKSDAQVSTDMDKEFINKVSEVKGVEHVYTTKNIINVRANDGSITLNFVEGMDGKGYSEYALDEFGKYLTEDILDQFTSKRSALISRFTARKYNLDKGDKLEMDINGKTVSYEIIEIVPSLWNNGNMTFVYENFLEEDTGITTYQNMYLNFAETADMESVIQEIKELMPYGILPILTHEEMRSQNNKRNNGVIFMMKAISVIAMFIGVIGILNNFTISFMSRKKIIATMRSLGLSRKKTIRNMLFEAFICGTLGTICGLAMGTVLLGGVCYLLEALGIPSEFIFSNIKDYIFVLISGVTLSILSAILPAKSIVKENIVVGLRYE
ncbi:MAG TPA: FtsX-like permease family protein [Mobilitalea sp.]|nr:FtsX-like permease family protein [Mobilitalea sp.]